MIVRDDISACDHCGACCQEAPCLLGSYKEVRAIEERVGSIRSQLQIERRPDNRWQVRISKAPCVFHVDNRCQIHDIKPKGGREFKCWDRRAYAKTYSWTANQLRKLGFVPTTQL